MTTIKVEGVREFVAALRKIDAGLPKQLRAGFKRAAESVATEVARRVPRRTGRASASVKARATQRSASVHAGGPKAPYFPWLDFGGRVGRKQSVVRPYLKGGRYLFPALDRKRDDAVRIATEAIEDVKRQAGLE